MRSFKDSSGREWQLAVTVRTVKEVKEATDILLTDLFENEAELLARLCHDIVLLVDIIWVMCRKQAESAGVSEEQFAESLGGDSLGQAAEAFTRAVTDFFSSPEQRKALHTMLDKMSEAAAEATRRAVTEITNLQSDSLVQSYIGSASSAPESSAANPGDIRLRNSA